MRSVNNNALDTISVAATAIASARTQASVQIRMLDLVLKASPQDSKEPQTAHILLYKLFYDQTDQGMTQFLLNQIKSFDTHKQAKSLFLTMAVFANIGGWIADTLVSKGLSVTTVRKIMQSIGFLGPAFFLTHLSHVKTPALAVLCMACSQGLSSGIIQSLKLLSRFC
ncbi:unnamed protein product [Camellia sinensis]